MSKGLEVTKRLKDFIERKAFELVEKQGIYYNDLKNQVLEDLRILEMSFYNYEQLKKVMDKYGIKTTEELEHIILNDATGEQTFKDYCGTTGHQHLNCEKLGLIKTDSGYGLVNTDLFPYDKDSDEECKKNLISNDLIKDLERLAKIDDLSGEIGIDEMFNDLSIIEKELKALEIIRKVSKNFPITLEEMISKSNTSQEEQVLIKEVLL